MHWYFLMHSFLHNHIIAELFIKNFDEVIVYKIL